MQKLKTKDLNSVRDELLENQEFKCGICKTDLSDEDNTNRHVDHNHDSGEIRGVLCRRCNLLEGTLYYRFRRSGHVSLETDYLVWLGQHIDYLKSAITNYEHPAHKNKLITQFKNMNKPEQIQVLKEFKVELSGTETKNEMVKKYRKVL